MRKLLLSILVFSCVLTSLSQKKEGDGNPSLQQTVVEKQIIIDNLENQVKAISFAAVRVSIRYKIASLLWKEGKDNSGRAETIAIRAVDDLYENKPEIPEVYFNALRPDLFILLDSKSKDTANKLREKYKIFPDDESNTIDALLNQAGGEKLATDAAIKLLTIQSQLNLETIFLIGQLQNRKSLEFFRLLTAVVNAAEIGRINFNTNDLLLLSGYCSETNVPIEVQKKFFKIVVNKSRNALQMPDGDVDEAFNLLSLIISDISTKFPELLAEAGTIQSALKIKVSKSYSEAQERGERIKNRSDKLSALISEAEQTDNQAVKYDLYVSAAQLALKIGKFKRAVDIVERTVELNKSETVSETFRKQWREQFFVQVVEKALGADDVDSANYATKKITDFLKKAESLRKTSNYYFDKNDFVSASYSLDEAIKLTAKADNAPQRIASFLNLIPAAQKIDKNRVSDLVQLIGISINAIPSLNVEDKPQTENYKNYVASVMNINRNLSPALMNLIKENKDEVINLANSIDNKEIKIISDYVLVTDSITQITKREKKQSKR